MILVASTNTVSQVPIVASGYVSSSPYNQQYVNALPEGHIPVWTIPSPPDIILANTFPSVEISLKLVKVSLS